MEHAFPGSGTFLEAHRSAQSFFRNLLQSSAQGARKCPAPPARRRDRCQNDDDGCETRVATNNNSHITNLHFLRCKTEQQELLNFPLIDCLYHFHRAAALYCGSSSDSLQEIQHLPHTGRYALKIMQKAVLPIIRLRFVLMMEALFCSGSTDDVERIADVFFATAVDGYFEVRAIRRGGFCELVSDLAPLLVDLCSFEAVLASDILRATRTTTTTNAAEGGGQQQRRGGEEQEVTSIHIARRRNDEGLPAAGGNNNNNNADGGSDGDEFIGGAVLDPFAIQAAKIQSMMRYTTRYVRKDAGVTVESTSKKEFLSGFAAKTAIWLAMWREGRTLLRADQDKLVTPPLRPLVPPIKFSRQNLLNAFSNNANKNTSDGNSGNNFILAGGASEEPVAANNTTAFTRNDLLFDIDGLACCCSVDDVTSSTSSHAFSSKSENSGTEKSKLLPLSLSQQLKQRDDDESEEEEGDDDGEGKVDGANKTKKKKKKQRVITAVLPAELVDAVFQFLLPSELHAAAVSCTCWQRVVLSRPPLRRCVQLAQTFTRRVKHFCRQEWGESCLSIGDVHQDFVTSFDSQPDDS